MTARVRHGRRAAAAFALLAAGCGMEVVDRWDGPPVVARHVAEPPDSVFPRLLRALAARDLTVARIQPAERAIELAWIAPPGDGRRYLRCAGTSRVGTASIQPRVTVRPGNPGSQIVVASRVRGTTSRHCVSTGAFEAGLLRGLMAAIAAGVPPALPAAGADP